MDLADTTGVPGRRNEAPAGRARPVRAILLALLFAVPLVPNPGWFTNADLPKWALLLPGLLLALVLVLLRALRSPAKVRVPLPETVAGVLVLALAGFVLGRRAPDPLATVLALARIGSLAAFGVLAARYLRHEHDALLALRAVGLSALAAAAVGLAGPFGSSATFGNPSFAAEFLAPVFCLSVPLALAPGRRRHGLPGLLAGAGLLPIFLTGESRADLAAAAAALLALLLLGRLSRARRAPPAWLLASGLLAAVLAVPYVFQALPVLFGPSETVKVREHLRASSLEMAADHPFAGVGLGGFRAHYPRYRHPEEVRLSLRREVTFPHNLPLSVLTETGVPGLLLLLLFLGATIWSGVKTVLVRRDDPVGLAALAGVIAILVSAQLSAPLRHPASGLLFFLLAGLLAARRPRRFVTDLSSRYRRSLPVVLLSLPALVGALHLPRGLVSDLELAAARRREVRREGEMDEEVARRLERSLAARPTPDALRQLAFYRTATGEPERALTLLAERLFPLSPYDEWGRIERARALLALGRAREALPDLDRLVRARPGDDGVLFLRARARWAAGETADALPDLYAAVRAAPEADARRYATWVNGLPDYVKDGLIRTAESIAESDLERGLAVLFSLSDWRARYAAAILLARRGERDRAMSILRAIRDRVPRERFALDPRLDPLRSRADFRSLFE